MVPAWSNGATKENTLFGWDNICDSYGGYWEHVADVFRRYDVRGVASGPRLRGRTAFRASGDLQAK